MGRRKSAEKLIRKKVVLRESTYNAVEKYLIDPLTGKAQYGEWSKLVEALIRKHLKEVANVTFEDLLTESNDETESSNGTSI